MIRMLICAYKQSPITLLNKESTIILKVLNEPSSIFVALTLHKHVAIHIELKSDLRLCILFPGEVVGLGLKNG